MTGADGRQTWRAGRGRGREGLRAAQSQSLFWRRRDGWAEAIPIQGDKEIGGRERRRGAGEPRERVSVPIPPGGFRGYADVARHEEAKTPQPLQHVLMPALWRRGRLLTGSRRRRGAVVRRGLPRLLPPEPHPRGARSRHRRAHALCHCRERLKRQGATGSDSERRSVSPRGALSHRFSMLRTPGPSATEGRIQPPSSQPVSGWRARWPCKSRNRA